MSSLAFQPEVSKKFRKESATKEEDREGGQRSLGSCEGKREQGQRAETRGKEQRDETRNKPGKQPQKWRAS